jgi:hypothetical protein
LTLYVECVLLLEPPLPPPGSLGGGACSLRLLRSGPRRVHGCLLCSSKAGAPRR